MVGIAISFVKVAGDDGDNVMIKLTYRDEDDDVITIGSTPELFDAIDQFADQKVLRLTVEIKRRNTMKKIATSPLKEDKKDGTAAPAESKTADTPASGTLEEGYQSGATAESRPKHPVLQNVVESIVNVVLNAAVAMNGNNSGNPNPPVFYAPDGMPATSPTVSPGNNLEERAKKATDKKPVPEPSAPVDTDIAKENEKEGNTKVKEQEKEVNVEDQKPKAKESPVDVPKVEAAPKEAPSKAATEEEEAKAEERPFIHGRHTCDNCLTTPIIGLRFHAKNLPDYDLCENCFGKYKGEDIQFEPVELDRDRNFQERWHRRHNRRQTQMNRKEGQQGQRFGPRGGPPHHRWGGPGRRNPRGGPHWVPPHHRHHGPPPHGPPPHGPPGHNGFHPPPPPPHHHPGWGPPPPPPHGK